MRFRYRFIVTSMLSCLLISSALAAPQSDGDGKRYLQDLSQAFQDVAETVTPAVVYIESSQTMKVPARQMMPRDFFDFFQEPNERRQGQPEEYQKTGLGSGVIVDAENGYVLTNSHVVADADKITVTVRDGNSTKKYDVEWVRADPVTQFSGTDVAVLKINGDDLPEAEIGDSNELRVGEWVLAIGNPFGLDQSVTAGIVSYVGRAQSISPLVSLIQTDAAINPGNSGGPLVNLNGEIVGINTAIVTGGWQRSYAGVGLAIPINQAKDVMEQLIEHGKAVHGWLGISMGDKEELSDESLAEVLGLDASEGGVLISRVIEDSPAEEAGLRGGDVIVAVDGQSVRDSASLLVIIAYKKPGDDVRLDVVRRGERKTITATLGEREGGMAAAGMGEYLAVSSLGLSLIELSSEEGKSYAGQLGIDDDEEGLLVVQVEPGSPAAEEGMQPGDVIQEIGRAKVSSREDLANRVAEIVESTRKGDNVKIVLLVRSQDGSVGYKVLEFEKEE